LVTSPADEPIPDPGLARNPRPPASRVESKRPTVQKEPSVCPVINGYVFEGGRELRLTRVPSSKSAAQAEEGDDIPVRFAFDLTSTVVNEQTTISYALPEYCNVSIMIYDATGRVVRSLVDDIKNPGYYQTPWKGDNDAGRRLSNGIYFCRIKAGDFTEAKKIVLMR